MYRFTMVTVSHIMSISFVSQTFALLVCHDNLHITFENESVTRNGIVLYMYK